MGCQAGVGAANLTTTMTDDKTETSKSYDTIKLGIDAHAKWYYVARQLDGVTPQPVQKMTFETLLRFVARQPDLAGEVHTCNEAGAFGYYLHRKLEALGVSNLVVQPQDWDERGKGVKTDRIDALRTWMAVLGDATRSAAARKKAIVAVARQLAVGLWRLFTGQTTAEKLGRSTCRKRPELRTMKSQQHETKPDD